MTCYFEVLHFVKMHPIFDGSVLTDFEKYKKITLLPVMWTHRTIGHRTGNTLLKGLQQQFQDLEKHYANRRLKIRKRHMWIPDKTL